VKKFIMGLILGIILVPAMVALYLASGKAPAAASDPPMPFERLIARKALKNKIYREMPTTTPLPADESTFLAGARVYRENCAMCHGLPNQPPPVVAKGMFPKAPQLLLPKEMVTDDEPGETFWKAKNGIRLSGMPGFASALSEQQMWQVSILLANADKIPASVQQALAAPAAGPSSAAEPNPAK
jgi:mono/diheme cytochrome c family protein